MTDHKSTATVMLAFFVVMASFLAFILFIPDKTLVHWIGILFILLAEFTFFIAQLFIQMLPKRTTHPLSNRLLQAYLFLTIIISVLFMLLQSSAIQLLSGIQLGMFLVTLVGLYYIGSKGHEIEDHRQ